MRYLILIILAMTIANIAWAMEPIPLSPSSDINTFVDYLDNVCVNMLSELELIATSTDAQNGNWKSIKEPLTQMNEIIPGVYFYMMPSGDYYSIEKDFTNFNLSNRAYFQSLMAGNPVKGFPVYSRSTGKKSVVFAYPITTSDKVSGALGVSIFLDDLHKKINDSMGASENQTWFVLDATGNTILDKDTEYIFMNALTQGTESLAKEVTSMLKNEQGYISYEIAGVKRSGQYRKLPSMDWWFVMVEAKEGTVKVTPQTEITLKNFVPKLQGRLDKIDNYMSNLVKNNKVNWDNEAAIRKNLATIMNELPEISDAAMIDVKGILRYIEPREYKKLEGADISKQEHVIALRKNNKPVFSSGFMSIEDILAADLAYPVYDKKGTFIGSVSLLINPTLLIKPILKDIPFSQGYEPWIMQQDGMIVYDPDTSEVGKMLFNDPMYKEYGSLQELGRKISTNKKGSGEYIYEAMGNQEKVIKTCIWDTVSLYGTEWRVILAHREQ